MRTRSGAEIVVDGDVVLKLHRPGTDPRGLSVRLRTAARLDCCLAPLSTEPEPVGMRWRTRWPRVETMVPEPDCVLWADAAQLLARLHVEAVGDRLPPHGWPGRVRRTVERLRGKDTDAFVTIRRAVAGLPPEAWRAGSPNRPRTLVHGDWHLGQLGRRLPAAWTLIDVDDLGVGDPAWDLARPAGFWAAGSHPRRRMDGIRRRLSRRRGSGAAARTDRPVAGARSVRARCRRAGRGR